MIVHINGWPGVGKLTVGRIVARQLGGRLLDNHTIYNPAFSLAEMKTPEFEALVRGVRSLVLKRVEEISRETPIVLTNFYTDSPWGNENWDAIVEVARRRKSRHLVVILDCAPDENRLRVQSPERALLLKLGNPDDLAAFRMTRTLLTRNADAIVHIDNTAMAPQVCADRIVSWVRDNMGP